MLESDLLLMKTTLHILGAVKIPRIQSKYRPKAGAHCFKGLQTY